MPSRGRWDVKKIGRTLPQTVASEGRRGLSRRRTPENLAPPSYVVPAPTLNCSSFDFGHALRAAVVQAVATTAGFGFKAVTEAATLALALNAGLSPEAAKTLSTIAGALYIGMASSPSGVYVNGFMNSAMNVRGYGYAKDQNGDLPSEAQKQLRELAAVTLPVYLAFTGAYAIRGAFTQGLSSIWMLAGSKMAASAGAALFQGFGTDAVRQLWRTGFTSAPPKDTTEEHLTNAIRNFRTGLNSRRQSWHDFPGKIVGALVGNLGAGFIAPKDFNPPTAPGRGAEQGAASMATFLAPWFIGIHLGALFGSWEDAAAATPVPPPPPQTGLVAPADQPGAARSGHIRVASMPVELDPLSPRRPGSSRSPASRGSVKSPRFADRSEADESGVSGAVKRGALTFVTVDHLSSSDEGASESVHDSSEDTSDDSESASLVSSPATPASRRRDYRDFTPYQPKRGGKR